MATRATNKEGRQHKATYSRDKKKGGYLVRVVGPNATAFAGRTVPVTRRDDTETSEELIELIWSGIDTGTEDQKGTGHPVALYTFKPHPKDETQEAQF